MIRPMNFVVLLTCSSCLANPWQSPLIKVVTESELQSCLGVFPSLKSVPSPEPVSTVHTHTHPLSSGRPLLLWEWRRGHCLWKTCRELSILARRAQRLAASAASLYPETTAVQQSQVLPCWRVDCSAMGLPQKPRPRYWLVSTTKSVDWRLGWCFWVLCPQYYEGHCLGSRDKE